jgi:hypothetical protein
MISFSTLEASSIICFIRASNSHLYFVPATIIDISIASTFLSFIENGTSHFAILVANHSTTAVLPTHGSQTRQGLFFVFLFKIAINLSISSALHITLSSFHSRASFVKSVEKKSRAGVSDSFFVCFQFDVLLLSNGV